MNEKSPVRFAPQDMKVILLLALSLGIITCAECAVAKNSAMIALAVGLNGVTFVLSLGAVYGLRGLRAKRKPSSTP